MNPSYAYCVGVLMGLLIAWLRWGRLSQCELDAKDAVIASQQSLIDALRTSHAELQDAWRQASRAPVQHQPHWTSPAEAATFRYMH